MRLKIFACICILSFLVRLHAAEPMAVTVLEKAEKLTAEAIHKEALVWIAEIPNDSGSALEYQNAETSTVVGNGNTSVRFGGMVKIQVPVRFKVRIEARCEFSPY